MGEVIAVVLSRIHYNHYQVRSALIKLLVHLPRWAETRSPGQLPIFGNHFVIVIITWAKQ